MMAASDDDCTLGAHFRVALGAGDVDEVRLFSGKQMSSFSVLRQKEAGEHEVYRSMSTTATNFFREMKSTHVVHFGPGLKLEQCEHFVKEVAPDKYREISMSHQAEESKWCMQFAERKQAIQEESEKAKSRLFQMLADTISGDLLQHSPREFFALRCGEVECSICQEKPLGQELGRVFPVWPLEAVIPRTVG